MARCHRAAPCTVAASDPVAGIAAAVLKALETADEPRVAAAVTALRTAMSRALASTAAIRERRARDGYIRRCHGDLHLGNIVLWDGRPVPFDAIEFDEALATIDTLYDFAFLIMDLERRGQREAANIVLNRYLWRTGDRADLEGLAALPLFLSLRAAVRAMVALDRGRVAAAARPDPAGHALDTLRLAQRFLEGQPPRLVAIGGLSGTGKSTLAAALAPLIGRAPGALHLRTDLERKALAGVEETDRLPASSYTPAAAAAVYARLADRTRLTLKAGHSVVVDGVFARADERTAIAGLATACGVRFDGIWLDAPRAELIARVGSRSGDASDATPAVVEQQLAIETEAIDWRRIDAGGAPANALAAARHVLSLA